MEAKKYTDIRHTIKNGDIILDRGNGIVEKIIRFYARRSGGFDCHHSRSALWIGSRLFAAEAIAGKGIVYTPISSLKGSFLLRSGLTETEQARVPGIVLDLEGVKYDYKAVLFSITGKRQPVNLKRLKCSEFSWVVYCLAKKIPFGDYAPWPSDLPKKIGGDLVKLI